MPCTKTFRLPADLLPWFSGFGNHVWPKSGEHDFGRVPDRMCGAGPGMDGSRLFRDARPLGKAHVPNASLGLRKTVRFMARIGDRFEGLRIHLEHHAFSVANNHSHGGSPETWLTLLWMARAAQMWRQGYFTAISSRRMPKAEHNSAPNSDDQGWCRGWCCPAV